MPFQSMSQLRRCFAADDPRWDCRKWLAHGGVPKTEGPKPKPDAKADAEKKASDDLDRRAFVADFIMKCAAEGVTDPGTVASIALVAADTIKRAWGEEALGRLGGAAVLAPLVGSVGLPLLAGYSMGGLAAGAKNQIDTDDQKTLALAAQANDYRRRAALARAHAEVRRLVASDPKKYVAVG